VVVVGVGNRFSFCTPKMDSYQVTYRKMQKNVQVGILRAQKIFLGLGHFQFHPKKCGVGKKE